MAINYSLSARLSKPNDKNSEKKVYATLQAREVIDKQALALHMAEHTSAFTQGELEGIITDLAKCIKEQLLDGNQVHLEPLGKIYLTVRKQTPSDDASVYSTAGMTVAVKMKADQALQYDINNHARFEYTTTRKQQAANKKLEKQKVNQKLGASATSGSEEP